MKAYMTDFEETTDHILVECEDHRPIHYRGVKQHTMIDNWLNIETSKAVIHINLDKVVCVSMLAKENEE